MQISELTTTAEEVTERALAWLEDVQEPFFLLVHTIDPHAPYKPPEGFDRYGLGIESRARGKPRWLQRDDLTEDDKARIRSLYFGEVAFADSQFGRLIEHLEAQGTLDDTVCVFTSDHGEEFWEHDIHGHGESLYDDALRVPLILRYPSGVPAGSRVASSVSSIDVFPTLFELTGIPLPGQVDGRSLLGAAGGEPRVVFASQRNHGRQLVSLRRGDLKLILDLKRDRRQLFDIRSDPKEGHDLAEARPVEAADLEAQTRATIERNSKLFEQLVGSVSRVTVDDIPEDERAVLEALGYMGEDDEQQD